MSQYGTSGENWYKPVDIGQHLISEGIELKELDKNLVKEIFKKCSILNEDTLKQYEKKRDLWLANNGEKYKNKFKNDKSFRLDSNGYPVSVNIYEFSKSEAKIYIKFVYGYSRWHHFYIVLANFLVQRDSFLDEVFDLKSLENKYSFSFKGVVHGMPVENVEEILGKDYYKYAGQSPQYQNIYYEQYNIEIIIQDWKVKYLQKGRPGWMESGMIFKK